MVLARSADVEVISAVMAEEAAEPEYVMVEPRASVVRKTSWPFSEVVPKPAGVRTDEDALALALEKETVELALLEEMMVEAGIEVEEEKGGKLVEGACCDEIGTCEVGV